MKKWKAFILVLIGVFAFAMTMAACSSSDDAVVAGIVDTDGDGIPDNQDAAPNDAAQFAAFDTATGLSNPAGGDFSAAVAINEGNTIVGLADTLTDVNKGAIWTVDAAAAESSTSIVLDSLDSNYSAAYAVNDSGTAVGESSNGADIVPVIWPAASTSPTALQPLAGGGANGSAYGINTAGQMIGEAQDANGNMVAVLWQDETTAATPLALLTGGATSSAYFVNDVPEAVGAAEDANAIQKPVFWNVNANTITELPLLNADDTSGIALGINAAGEIVGEVVLVDSTREAVLWRPDGAGGFTVTDLGSSSAAAINDVNRISGNVANAASVWDSRSVVPATSNSLGAGFAVSQAYSMNDSNIIVGIMDGRAFAIAPQ